MKTNDSPYLRMLTACIWLLLTGSTAFSQSIVRATLICPETVRASDTIDVEVHIDVDPGWYIYAPGELNLVQQVQVAKMSIQAIGLKEIEKVSDPKTTMEGSYEVYMGKPNVFVRRFIVLPGKYEKTAELNANFTFQACNDRACLPPQTVSVSQMLKRIP